MALGQPLNDYDRADWLSDLSGAAVSYLSTGSPVVIVACSALRVAYRDVFRLAVSHANEFPSDAASIIDLHFIFLRMDEKKAMGLVDERGRLGGHFMPPTLVKSQFETLEEPDEYELAKDCVVVDSDQSTRKVQECSYAIVKHYVRQG
jgi:gluconokinase